MTKAQLEDGWNGKAIGNGLERGGQCIKNYMKKKRGGGRS